QSAPHFTTESAAVTRFTYDARSRQTQALAADGTSVRSAYAPGLVVVTDQRGNVKRRLFDVHGRLTRVEEVNGLETNATTFGYDALGRVVELRRRLDATTYTMFLGYNALGQVVMRTFPDGEVVPYSFNEAGWLAAIPGWVSSIAYNARGQQTELRHANGVTSTWTYHPTNFRLTGRTTAGAAGPLQSLAYASDAAGNVTQIHDALFTGSR